MLFFFWITRLLYWCQGKKAQGKGRSNQKEISNQARTKAEATKGEQHHKAVRNSRGSIGKHGQRRGWSACDCQVELKRLEGRYHLVERKERKKSLVLSLPRQRQGEVNGVRYIIVLVTGKLYGVNVVKRGQIRLVGMWSEDKARTHCQKLMGRHERVFIAVAQKQYCVSQAYHQD